MTLNEKIDLIARLVEATFDVSDVHISVKSGKISCIKMDATSEVVRKKAIRLAYSAFKYLVPKFREAEIDRETIRTAAKTVLHDAGAISFEISEIGLEGQDPMLKADMTVLQAIEPTCEQLELDLADFIDGLFSLAVERAVATDLQHLLAEAVGDLEVTNRPEAIISRPMLDLWSLPDRGDQPPTTECILGTIYLDKDGEPTVFLREKSHALEFIADMQSVDPSELIARYLIEGAKNDLQAWLAS